MATNEQSYILMLKSLVSGLNETIGVVSYDGEADAGLILSSQDPESPLYHDKFIKDPTQVDNFTFKSDTSLELYFVVDNTYKKQCDKLIKSKNVKQHLKFSSDTDRWQVVLYIATTKVKDLYALFQKQPTEWPFKNTK